MTVRYLPTRRRLLRHAATLAAAPALSMPFIRPSRAARVLRVSSYGGICEESYAKYLYPAFTKASGIAVQSIPQAEGLAFLLQLAQANHDGSVPMDLVMLSQIDVLRARSMGMLRRYDPRRIATLSQIPERYLAHGEQGLDGVGMMAFYLSLVVNTQERPQLPDSWHVFWEKSDEPSWGVIGQGGLSDMFDITAQLFFGGGRALETHEGIDQVVAKIAEAKPNIQLWWQDEGTMQTALQNEQVVGGMYFNDDANTLARAGMPIRSIFPKEGAVEDFSCWCQPTASTRIDEAYEFMSFSCTPQAQALIAQHEGSAPVMDVAKLDLPAGALDRIKPTNTSITVDNATRLRQMDYMTAKFNKMIAS